MIAGRPGTCSASNQRLKPTGPPSWLWIITPRTQGNADFPHATVAEVAKMHHDLLLRVELIQAEELATLRCLAKHHGAEDVWAEG